MSAVVLTGLLWASAAQAKGARLVAAQRALLAARAPDRPLTVILSPFWGKGVEGARLKWREFLRHGRLSLSPEINAPLLRAYRDIAREMLATQTGDLSVVRYRARLAKAALKRLGATR